MKCNQSLHYQYHQDWGHTTEDCRTLRDYLEQLVKIGKLKQFLYQPFGQGSQAELANQRDASSRLPLGTISVILATPGRTDTYPPGGMSIAKPHAKDSTLESKRGRKEVRPALNFSDQDKIGTYQLHNDALVVTFRIWGYDVRRVLVDQGSGAEIMYPDLYKGLKLKLEDLISNDSPLVGFIGKTVVPKG